MVQHQKANHDCTEPQTVKNILMPPNVFGLRRPPLWPLPQVRALQSSLCINKIVRPAGSGFVTSSPSPIIFNFERTLTKSPNLRTPSMAIKRHFTSTSAIAAIAAASAPRLAASLYSKGGMDPDVAPSVIVVTLEILEAEQIFGSVGILMADMSVPEPTVAVAVVVTKDIEEETNDDYG